MEYSSKEDIAILTLGKIAQMFLLLISVRIYTAYLPNSEIGSLVLIISTFSLFSLVAINPVGVFINRSLHGWDSSGTIFRGIFIFSLYVFSISLLAFFTPFLFVNLGIGLSINTFLFGLSLSLFLYFNTLNQTVIPSLNLFLYRKQFVVFTTLSLVIHIVFSTIIVDTISTTAFGWIFGQIVGLMIGFFYALKFLVSEKYKRISVKKKADTGGFQGVFKFSLPLAVSALFIWTLINAHRFFIEYFDGIEQLAYIGLGFTIATSLSGSVESLLMQVFHADFYNKLSLSKIKSEREAAFQELVNSFIPPLFISLLCIIILSPYITTILTGERFLGLYKFLIAGVVIEFFRIYANLLTSSMHSEHRTSKGIVPYVVGALISLVFTYIAMLSNDWKFFLPVALILSWFLVFYLMIRYSKRVMEFNPFPRGIPQLIIMCLPIIALSLSFTHESEKFLTALFILALSGVYIVCIMYYIFIKKTSIFNYFIKY